MTTLPIGVVIKQIVHKKNLSPARLAAKTGLSRQAVYNTYSRSSMNEEDLEKWADALGMTVKELQNYGGEAPALLQPKSQESDPIAELKRLFEEELREKNEQIRALQEALRQAQNLSTALLGKSPERPDGKVLPNVFKRFDLPEAAAVAR
jgi:transcriptional regulator with XRE-family HTH domain